MVDVAAAISAVSAAIGLAREINQIDVEVDKAGLKLKVAELTSALADAKLAIAGTGESISALEKEISDLKVTFRFKAENTTRRLGFTYDAHDDGDPVGLPYCPVCEQDGRFIHLVELLKDGRPGHCPRCKANYGRLEDYVDR